MFRDQGGKIQYAFAVFMMVMSSFAFSPIAQAAAGINKQVNFQGKVVNTDGTNVSNASYTFLFCLYTTASPSTACTSGANNDAVWRESKSITVTDGVFQTALGDTTALPGSVDFNTDNIYLGVNFNANGQMSPLIRFTAVPYAFNADKIHGLSVTDTTGTLTIPNGKTISFADAFTTSGAFPLTLTSSATTNATLPSGTITLADLATTQTLTNKTIGSTGLIFAGAATDITTGTNEDLTLVANGTGIINLNDATTILGTTLINSTGTATTTIGNSTGTFALTSNGGLNVTTGGALTGVASLDTINVSSTALTFAGTGTIASTTNGLTLDSGNNTLTIASSDTALTASGVATITLAANASITNASGNLTLQPAGSGTTANVQIGAGGAGSTTPDLLVLDGKSNAGDPTATKGAMYYNVSTGKFRCSENGTTFVDCIGAGGGTPAGSTTQIQYNNAGAFGADAGFTFDSSTQTLSLAGTNADFMMKAVTNEPATPSAGNLTIYTKDIGGRILPKWKGPSGLDTPFQPALFLNAVGMISPQTGTTITQWGMPNTTVGTASTPTQASTNMHTSLKRITVTSATTANSASELRSAQFMAWRGNAAGLGGFFMTTRFAVNSTTTNQRLFIGMLGSTAAISTSQSPSSLTNCAGVGWDSADTNLQFMSNDGSGTATKVDLGSNFPANNTTAVYELVMFAPPNGSTISYRVTRLDTGNETTGTVSASADLPVNTQFLSPHEYMNNGGTAAAVVLDVMRVYVETDY